MAKTKKQPRKKTEKAKAGKPYTCKLVCPKCKKHFADLKYNFDTQIDPEDIVVLEGDKKFQKDEALACTACGYNYMSWDIYIAIAEDQENAKAS